MITNPTEAVIFDLDNTLVNRYEAFVRLFEHWYDTLLVGGCHADRDTFVIRMAKHADYYEPLADIYLDMLKIWPGSISNVGEAVEAHSNLMPEMVKLNPRTEQMLRRFRAEAIQVGVVTNGGTTVQWGKLRNTGIADLVTACVVSEEFGARKPDPSIFVHALELIGASPESTLFVGDNPEDDIVGADSVGMSTAWISLGREWELTSIQPDHVLQDVWDVKTLVSAP